MILECKHIDKEFQPNRIILIDLPFWLLDDLCKIQSAWRIPLSILIREQLEGFVLDNWSLQHDRPKKLRWQREDEKKPRPQSRLKLTKQNPT